MTSCIIMHNIDLDDEHVQYIAYNMSFGKKSPTNEG
jgi:hypothetical protein